jgi:hypothetical protein
MGKSKSYERIKERFSYEQPDLVSVKCRIEKRSDDERECVLNVIDSSQSGIALLIAPKDSHIIEMVEVGDKICDIIEMVEVGDKICDMSFFGVGAKIKEDGIIKHITKIEEGQFKGYFILGIEAEDV